MNMNIALCICVRNCEPFLQDIFSNIKLVKTLNVNVYSIFVYDNCSDNSQAILEEYQKNNDNVIVRNIINTSEYRTERIAKARNECLSIVYNELNDISFHIMIDCDDRCTPKWNIDVINNYLNNFDNDNWDCISFNRHGYYDLWALLIDDFRHHCHGYNGGNVPTLMQKYIKYRLDSCETNSIEVFSAFNGFCIYKTEKFNGLCYDGLYRNIKTLISDEDRLISLEAVKKYGLNVTIDDTWIECCEHLFYHLSAFKKGLKIKVSKFIVI